MSRLVRPDEPFSMTMALRERRFPSNLSVSVVGTDTYGNRFKQSARAENISRRGALLAGIRCLRAAGDTVEVEHRGHKAVFRIVWMNITSGHVGICCLDESYIWGVKLPEPVLVPVPSEPTPAEPPGAPEPIQSRQPAADVFVNTGDAKPLPTSVEGAPPVRQGTRMKRRFPRYRCTGGVTASAKRTATKLWGRVTVIGMGGCYIETVSPLQLNTQLELLIGVFGGEIKLQGEVRYSHPREGMGVMFIDMSPSKRDELQGLMASACRN